MLGIVEKIRDKSVVRNHFPLGEHRHEFLVAGQVSVHAKMFHIAQGRVDEFHRAPASAVLVGEYVDGALYRRKGRRSNVKF